MRELRLYGNVLKGGYEQAADEADEDYAKRVWHVNNIRNDLMLNLKTRRRAQSRSPPTHSAILRAPHRHANSTKRLPHRLIVQACVRILP